MDYQRIKQLNVTFLPEEMRKPVSFTLLNDIVTEPTENFGILVSRNIGNPDVTLGIDSAIIIIEETDGRCIGYMVACMLTFPLLFLHSGCGFIQ